MTVGKRRALLLGVCSVALFAGTAHADVTSFEVEYTAPFGTFGTHTYTYVEGTMTGTATNGNYAVPVVLIYPTDGGNGYGVADFLNTAFFEQYPRTNSCMSQYQGCLAGGGTEETCGMARWCFNNSFASPCQTRGDFICENEGSIPLSDNKYEEQLTQNARLMTEDLMFKMGFTYIAAQHHKAVTEHFGAMPPDGGRKRLAYGSIDVADDGYDIFVDSARFLRAPTFADGSPLDDPTAVTKIVGWGFSQGAFAFKTMLHTNMLIEDDDSLIVDGLVIGGGGGICRFASEINPMPGPICGANNDEFCSSAPTYWYAFPCLIGGDIGLGWSGLTIPPGNRVKIMNLQTEAEYAGFYAEFAQREWTLNAMDADCAGGPLAVGNVDCEMDPNYYNYDLTGVAHIPGPHSDMSWVATTDRTPKQNPADFRPYFRAMLSNMYDWLEDDTAPPEHVNFEGAWDFSGLPDNPPVFNTNRDHDFHMLGGVRPPHMPRYDYNSDNGVGCTADAFDPPGTPDCDAGDDWVAGAPLGLYGAVNPAFIYALPPEGAPLPPFMHAFGFLSGTFDPYDADELAARYADRVAYDAMVKAAADDLLAKRFILQEDYDAYIAGAIELPEIPESPDAGVTSPDAGMVDNGGDDGCGCAAQGTGSGLGGGIVLLMAVFLLGLRRRVATRRNIALLVSAFALVFAAACGDDDDPAVDAGPEPDAKPCVGHFCETPDDPIYFDEAGEVRLELIYTKDGAIGLGRRGSFEVRNHAWFASAQTPPLRPFARDPKDWYVFDDTSCSDVRAKTFFPNGMPESRTYLDVGDTVTVSSGSAEFVMDMRDNLQDQTYDNTYEFGYTTDIEPDDLIVDAEYTVELSGTDTFAARTLSQNLYIPADFDLSFPDMSQHVEIPPGEDYPFIWTDDAPDDDAFLFAFAVWADPLGANFFCVGPNSGGMLIPQEVLDQLPATGIIQFGLLSHRAVKLGEEDKRVDLLGLNCVESMYTIQDYN